MKTITQKEALALGYDTCFAPGYDPDFDCTLIEYMEPEDIVKFKPIVCKKEPRKVDEKKEVVYYDKTDLQLIPDTIRALWLNNPYCHLMYHGNKLETRTRDTKVRGPVLLCSCKKPYSKETVHSISGYTQATRIASALSGVYEQNGYALYLANLVDSRPMRPGDTDRAFVAYRQELFIWEFKDITPIEAFPIKGKQGWMILPDDIKQQLKYTTCEN